MPTGCLIAGLDTSANDLWLEVRVAAAPESMKLTVCTSVTAWPRSLSPGFVNLARVASSRPMPNG